MGRIHSSAAPTEVRLGVLLFGLTGILGLLAPFGAPGSDVPLVLGSSLTSITIAVTLWACRHRVRPTLYLPLVVTGLALNEVGLAACHATATMAASTLPAILWASHYLARRRDVVAALCAASAMYGVAVAVDAPTGTPRVSQWLLTTIYLGLAAGVTHAASVRLNALVCEKHEIARIDALTGLANRRRLLEDLDALVAAEPHTVTLLDLNGFKAYNDRYGHLAGDDLLRELGRRFAGALADGDRAYRLGGDEFCALLRGTDPHLALPAITAAFTIVDTHGDIDAAWGDAAFPAEASDARGLLGLADRRMYERKRALRHHRLLHDRHAS